MRSLSLIWHLGLVLTVLGTSGCMVPQCDYNTILAQNRVLSEQNRAQLAEIENLKIHSRNTEEQLKRTEEEIALVESRFGLDRQRLANYEQEQETLRHEAFDRLDGGAIPISPDLSRRLAEVAEAYPHLKFDPNTGIAKVDVDILFEKGQDEIKPAARRFLKEMASVLKADEAKGLRLFVAGHTDDQAVGRRESLERHSTNFQLSSSRALAVARQLELFGVDTHRIGVAGFGAHQPVAPNSSEKNRYKNRRVEIFVMAPNVPVVGWTETIPTVYR